MNRYPISPRSTQTGAVLVVSLMLLVIMTLIGVTAMRSTILQEKMAGNTRDSMLALQAAETTLLDGEGFVENSINALAVAFDGNQPGLYPEGVFPDLLTDATWAIGVSRVYSGAYPGVTTQPRYIIELLGLADDPNDNLNAGSSYDESEVSGTRFAFRITARGTGGTDNAKAIIQSNYVRTF